LFRDRYEDFKLAGRSVRGVSTQRPDEQRAFAASEAIPFPLLSDSELGLAAAARLPTFRVGGAVRLKRLIMIADRERRIRAALYPVNDIPAAIDWALTVDASA
jgi:peroxiredoxin